jgi:hypothetical protein
MSRLHHLVYAMALQMRLFRGTYEQEPMKLGKLAVVGYWVFTLDLSGVGGEPDSISSKVG